MYSRSSLKRKLYGEFILRSQNARGAPLHVRWNAQESLYYGGVLEVLDGATGIRSRFERRMSDMSWMKNDPNKIAGGRPFTESFYTTFAVLIAFADAERLTLETIHSPVPMTSSSARHLLGNVNAYQEDAEAESDRGVRQIVNPDLGSTTLSGSIHVG
jgi:hypothetical protein